MSMQTSIERSRHHNGTHKTEEYSVDRARILLAEDDRDLRSLLAAELRREGYIVEEAASGYGLLEVLATLTLRNETCDLIITDIRMPGLTGLAIVDALRHGVTHGTSGTPVILITAFGDDETHAEAKRLGTVLLDKPFSLPEFRSTVASLIGSVPT